MTRKLTTAGQLAEHLAVIAEQLRHATPDTPDGPLLDVALSVHVGGYLPQYTPGDDEAARVAAVDRLAALVDLTAARRPRAVGHDDAHDARRDAPGFTFRISTRLAPPPKRCACGATCTHGQAGVSA